MKPDRRSLSSSSSLASSGIDKTNWADRAKAFIAGRGGTGFVIRAVEGAKGSLATRIPATEPQWVAWMLWFASKGIPTKFAYSHGLMTVPTEWPEDFDLECSPSNRDAYLPKSPSTWRNVQNEIDRATSGARMPRMAPRVDWEPERAAAKQYVPFKRPLEELAADLAKKPLAPLSQAALDSFKRKT